MSIYKYLYIFICSFSRVWGEDFLFGFRMGGNKFDGFFIYCFIMIFLILDDIDFELYLVN